MAQSIDLSELTQREYPYGFATDLDVDAAPRGLNEDVIRLISEKKDEPAFLLDWRLRAYRHWLTMTEPRWQSVHYEAIDYQDIIYYSAPKAKGSGPKNLDEVDPALLAMFNKLGISVAEFIRRAVRQTLPAPGTAPWMKYAGFVSTGDPNSSQSIDEIVYGSKD